MLKDLEFGATIQALINAKNIGHLADKALIIREESLLSKLT